MPSLYKTSGQVSNLAIGVDGTTLIPFALGSDEIAAIRVIHWTQALFPIQWSTSHHDMLVVANLSHDLGTETTHVIATNWFRLPTTYAPFVTWSDTLSSGGVGMIPQLVINFPKPGYWVGGTQLMYVFNDSEEGDITTNCMIYYEKIKVGAGEAVMIRERTVIQKQKETL